MSSLSRELVFLILQFLDEEKFKETVHKLEHESGFYFNMKHFEDQVLAGEWNEVERYLSGFTKVEDNRYSMKIFFEIRKQKYLEALDRNDRSKAVDVLVKDLKVFASFNEELFKEITQLLTLENFRQNEQLSKYGDTKSARNIMLIELKKLVEANPLFRDKLAFPPFKASRLRTLINQSLNWQHQLCKNPRPNPDIKTLFTDHSCATTNVPRPVPPTNASLVGPLPKSGPFPPLVAHSPFQPVVSHPASAIAGWMSGANQTLPHAAVAQGHPGLLQPTNIPSATFMKHPRAPSSATVLEYQTVDSEHFSKKLRCGQSDEVSFAGAIHLNNIYCQDDLPRTVVRTLNQGSSVMSFDFHPQHQSFLLVGTNVGEISIWEVGSRERIAHKAFKMWDISVCSMPLQAALMKDTTISVNRCLWSPDGSIVGVAFSKHMVQTYAYTANGELRNQLELDAHVGGVNDIAFAHPNKSLSIITCGDDKMIKVWDAMTGQRQHVFEGHEAPVYSICPHSKEAIQFIFSTAVDGKIKAWLYDCLGSRVDYDAPGHWCTTMAYSADGSRLDYQSRSYMGGRSSLRQLIARLPPRAHSIYYRDEIGNISTSHLWGDSRKTQLEIEPRFPIFGGWRTSFTIGYGLPLQDFLFVSEGNRFLNITFGCPMDEVVIDDLIVKVVLPEGSKEISVSVPFHTKQWHETKYSHLDIIGRPVIVLKKSNVVPEHNTYFQVHYKFNNLSLLWEPLMLISGFLFLFVACIAYMHADMSISKSSASYIAKLQWDEVQATVQQVQNVIRRCLSAHQKLETSLQDLSRTGDVQSCKATRKIVDGLLKELSKELKPLMGFLHSSPQAAQIWPKVEELVAKEKEMQEKLIQKHVTVVDCFEKKYSGREIENRVAPYQQKLSALKQEVDDLLDFIDEI